MRYVPLTLPVLGTIIILIPALLLRITPRHLTAIPTIERAPTLKSPRGEVARGRIHEGRVVVRRGISRMVGCRDWVMAYFQIGVDGWLGHRPLATVMLVGVFQALQEGDLG